MTDPTSLPNFQPPSGNGGPTGPGAGSPLRDRVVQALTSEGFRPEIDAEGDVTFKIEGQQLFIHCAEGELPLMRVFGQWQIGEELPKDPNLQLRHANDLTLRLNLAKVGINGDTVVVTCEHVVQPETEIVLLMQVSTQLILTAVQMWHQLMLGHDVFGQMGDPQAGQ